MITLVDVPRLFWPKGFWDAKSLTTKIVDFGDFCGRCHSMGNSNILLYDLSYCGNRRRPIVPLIKVG